MTEDVEEFAPWWKVRWYQDGKLENKLIEAIRVKDKLSTGTVYRLFLKSGILFFFAGWILWNIGLPAEGESGAVGMNLKTLFFFTGIFVQLALGPYRFHFNIEFWTAISFGAEGTTRAIPPERGHCR